MVSKFLYNQLGVGELPQRTKSLVKKFLLLQIPAHSLFMLSNTFFILFIIDNLGYIEAGLLLSMNFLIHALIDYPTGVIGDWIGQRWILFIAFIGYGIAFLFLGSYCFINSPYIIVLSYIIFAISSSQESGAFQAWFDNNYKITVGEDLDPDRTYYKTFQGKKNLLYDVSGGIMIITGGLLATIYFRESVFFIQAFGLGILSFIILYFLTDYPEITREKQSFSSYLNLLKEGVTNVINNRPILLLVSANVLYTVPIIIFFDLTLFPIYFGYTGSDLGASVFRFIMFYGGAIGVWFLTDIIQKLNIKRWIPRIQIFHTIFFYGGLAIFSFLIPLENILNPTGAVIFGIIILISHVTRVSFSIIIQRIYLDVIPDNTRNSFYSLLPTLMLIVSSPLMAISGYIGEEIGFPFLFTFLGILAFIGSILYIIICRKTILDESNLKSNNKLR